MDTEFEGNIYTSFSLQVIQKLASFVLGPEKQDSARALRLSSSCSATGIQKTHWCLKHLWQREIKYQALDRPLYVNRSADFQDFEAKTMPPSADNYSLLRKQLLAWHWAPGETELSWSFNMSFPLWPGCRLTHQAKNWGMHSNIPLPDGSAVY